MVVHVSGYDWEKIGVIDFTDLGLKKCANCNQTDRSFDVKALVHVNKVLVFQASPKFGILKSKWKFFVGCKVCEKGYSFEKEKGRDDLQNIMLKKESLLSNVEEYFLYEHGLFNHIDNRQRKEMLKLARKKKKTLLDDLAKLGMNDLLQQLLSGKQNYIEELRNYMTYNQKIGFDIEL